MRANSGPPGRGRGAGAARARARERRPARGRRRRRRRARRPGAAQARGGGRRGRARQDGGPTGGGPLPGARGGVSLEPATPPFPFDPKAPPVATFFEAGGNIEGGLPYTPWAAEIKKQRTGAVQKDNPDAMCLPMGFLQFHQQPQPRKIIQMPKMILIEYEANYGLRHIYMDGRKLPPQGEPQPWWYGYSVGRWEGDTLVVETNNLRGAEESLTTAGSTSTAARTAAGEVHRALPPADVRPAADRHHARGSEGVHETLDRPCRPALAAGRGVDRIRLQREPAVPPPHQDRLGVFGSTGSVRFPADTTFSQPFSRAFFDGYFFSIARQFVTTVRGERWAPPQPPAR